MATFISILIFIVSILLILIVLVQNPKGGLAANFSSSNQVMGVRKTSDFLEKATWTLGIALVVLSIVSSTFMRSGEVKVEKSESELKDEVNQMADPVQAPPIQTLPSPEEGDDAPVEGEEDY